MSNRVKIGSYSSSRGGREKTYDHDKIKKLILENKSDQEVADKVGCSKTIVQKIRLNMGIKRGKPWNPWNLI
jgi:DNA invertase Pin-like site-specific DNA recombinase